MDKINTKKKVVFKKKTIKGEQKHECLEALWQFCGKYDDVKWG